MERTIEGITYRILPPNEVRRYVLDICKKEWAENDFLVYGNDLYKSAWETEEILISKISVNNSLLMNEEFKKDLLPRIEKQQELHKTKTAIPPLILRGNDLLIFDGYARYHYFKNLEIEKCLAYVGRRNTTVTFIV